WANADDVRRHAAELVALAPDIILAGTGTATVAPLLQATRTVPIVFVSVIDPVGAGFVVSLAKPGGNATGFTIYEYSMSGKWLELLKEIAPRVTRAAVLRDTVRRCPDRRAVIGGGLDASGSARCQRYRARGQGIRARLERRPDRDGKCIGDRASRADRHTGGPAQTARGLFRPLLRHSPHLLRSRSRRPVPARGCLRRSHPQRRETGRPAGANANQVRSDHQPQNRQGARPRCAAHATRACRRGDRISTLFAAPLLG